MKAKPGAIIGILVVVLFTTPVWGQVEVPEVIKKIVPIMKGAKAVQAMQIEEGAQVVLEVPQSPKEVITFYRDAMEKKGWHVVMQMDMQQNVMLNLAKDNMHLMVNASADQDGNTMVQLVLQTDK